jgi:serine/threonine protein kinase
MFLLMELIDGVSIEQHPLTTMGQLLNIYIQVADGLAHMHECGFVHADMKPNNVIVTDEGTAKVIDLGQSCAVGTVKERIQGTPDYIAPEQVHRREITEKTDIYNLGASMYWSLTGIHIPTALPRGDSLISGAQDDHLIDRPHPPSELIPGTDPLLEALILQCVEVELDRRPKTMTDVARALRDVRRGLEPADKEIPLQVRADEPDRACG